METYYLWHTWPHPVWNLKQISVRKLESFISVGKATLPNHIVQFSIDLVIILKAIESQLDLRIGTVWYNSQVRCRRTNVQFADQGFEKPFHSFPIATTNTPGWINDKRDIHNGAAFFIWNI